MGSVPVWATMRPLVRGSDSSSTMERMRARMASRSFSAV